MAISSLHLFVFIVNIVKVIVASQYDRTKSSWCGKQLTPIKFPFRLRDSQPKSYCRTDFDLFCTSKNETVLHLPFVPINFYVSGIDYHSQKIGVYIPDDQWSRKNPGLEFINLSSSPFRFTHGFSHVTLLNCPSQPSPSGIPCRPGGHSHSICPVFSNSHIEYYRQFVSCSKMYDFGSPVDPNDMSKLMGPFSLTWYYEEQHKKENGSGQEFKCQNRVQQRKGPSKKSKAIAGSTAGSFVILMMVVIAILYAYPSDKDAENRLRIEKFLEEYRVFQPSRYAYADIKRITNKFQKKLGQGAYGTVFKGKLSNDILVAVKVLDNNTRGNRVEFINEVAIMGRIHHVNVARLVGYCADGLRRALVYEFLSNGSLEKYLSSKASNKKCSLSWEKLQQIALGIAKGIEYLHQGCDQRILHFDIKPRNILLDRNFIPKIADFGLAKLCSKDTSIVSMTTARGTKGYIAPEVFSRNFGNVSYKSDVYSFGMLLLEMVKGSWKYNSGWKVENADEIYYPEWIYNMLEEGELMIKIQEEPDAKIAKKLAFVGLWCIQWHPVSRPTMKFVVQMLEAGEELTMPPNPFASVGLTNPNNKIPTRVPMAMELETIDERV
ncbi:rust resistance kinase Lr10 [Morus notabilis]|uniref:rust resistance kinase Lr10 n=1 Tax=Morus notabilis TaxID=981085 RepID=UPI000CECE4A9|nr:rust resistance kinase Lr10 [Morus notabilis]